MCAFRRFIVFLYILFLTIILTFELSYADTGICGDGVLHYTEQCDDGEFNSDLKPDACRPNCRIAHCGDGVIDTSEECDDWYNLQSPFSNSDSPIRCRMSCKLPICGDGIIDDGSYGSTVYNEACDDGNTDNNDACRNNCKKNPTKAPQIAGALTFAPGENITNVSVVSPSRPEPEKLKTKRTSTTDILDSKNAKRENIPGSAVPKSNQENRSQLTKVKPTSTIVSTRPARSSPRGKVVTKTFLNLNIRVKRVDIYAGPRRLGRLPEGKHFDITSYVSRAQNSLLTLHYFDTKGVKTIQKIKVGINNK